MGMWGWGFLFSPALSGILAEPLRQYPNSVPGVFEDFLVRFPFILPNLLSAVFCSMAVLGVHYCVPETLPSPRHPVHIPLDAFSWVKNRVGAICDVFCLAEASGQSQEVSALLGDDSRTKEEMTQQYDAVAVTTTGGGDLESSNDTIRQSRMLHTESCSMLSTAPPGKSVRREDASAETDAAPRDATVLSLWSQRNTRNHLIVNWVYSFVDMALEEAFPLYCISRKSGLGLSEATIGKLLSSSGLIFAISQYFIYSYLVDRVGLKRSIQIAATLSGPLLILLPISRHLNHRASEDSLTWSAFVFLSILLACYRVFSICFFSSITISSNRTVLASHRGTMNGLYMLGQSVTKGLGPIFAGALVSFSTSSGIVAPAFGGVVIYSVLGLLGAIHVAMTFFLLDEPRAKEAEKATE
jgi:MFS family permease